MSALGQPGSNAHSSHAHAQVPGLSFPQVNGLRRGYPPHSTTPPKPSSTPQQHHSPYQPQPYPHQQPPQAAHYPNALFSNPTPSVSTLSAVPIVPNGTSRHTPNQTHATSAVPAPRQRGGPPRQISQQPSQMQYLQQAMNQPMPQQLPQPVQQVQQIQALQQPHQAHPPHPQAHQQNHVQASSQVHQLPQAQPPPVQQVQQPQPVHQPNDSNLMSHTPPRMQAHPQQPHQQPHQPMPQVQQQTPQLPPQPTPQPQSQSVVPPPQSESSVPPHESHHDEMDLDSHGEVDGDSHLSPRPIDGTPFVPRAPMGLMMSAPPEGGSFASLEAVHKYVLQYCTSVGYAVVIGRSKKTVPGLKKVLFVCDRAGKPPTRVSPEHRKRKTSSRKCDCQFGFFAIEQRTQWTIRYRPDPAHLQHNHGPSESPLQHPAARKLDSKMVAAVKQLKESGIGVSQTLEILQQQHPHVPLLPRDIYNARAAINRNPQKVEEGIAEERPAIYSKPPPTAEERIRSDLRRELQKVKDDLDKEKEDRRKEVEGLKKEIVEKDKLIQKFEMFIDICNQRVMLQREKLADTSQANGDTGGASN